MPVVPLHSICGAIAFFPLKFSLARLPYVCGIIVLHNGFFTMAPLVITSRLPFWKYRWMWSSSAVERLWLRKHVLLLDQNGFGHRMMIPAWHHQLCRWAVLPSCSLRNPPRTTSPKGTSCTSQRVHCVPPHLPLCALCNIICVTVIPVLHPYLIDLQVF